MPHLYRQQPKGESPPAHKTAVTKVLQRTPPETSRNIRFKAAGGAGLLRGSLRNNYRNSSCFLPRFQSVIPFAVEVVPN